MLAKFGAWFVASWFFKPLMWILLGVSTLLVAIALGFAFCVCAPIVAVYAVWEFMVGRHKPDDIDAELRKMLEDAR